MLGYPQGRDASRRSVSARGRRTYRLRAVALRRESRYAASWYSRSSPPSRSPRRRRSSGSGSLFGIRSPSGAARRAVAVLPERPVRAMAVVVVGVSAQAVLELPAADDQQPTGTLPPQAPNPALGVRPGPQRADRHLDHADP